MNIQAGNKYFWTTEGRNVRVKALTEDDEGRWNCRLLEASARDGLDKGDEKKIKAKNLSDLAVHPVAANLETSAAKGAAFEEKLGAAASGFLDKPKKPAKEVPPAAPKIATPLVGTSIVFCGDSPVLILSGANSTWSDVMCWHIPLQTTMHLHRVDLEPKDAVDATITELQKHIKIQSHKVK